MSVKKTVNAFGCCCTRNIFNYDPIASILDVNKYAFQIAIWSCFEPSLNWSDEVIDKIPEKSFTKRMIKWDVNKSALKEFEDNKSDYFMLDLTTLSFPVFKIEHKGCTTYIQNWMADSFMPKLKNIPELADVKYKRMTIDDVDQEIILNGLNRFCDWVLNHYDVKNIVLYLPRRSEKYITIDGVVMNYPEKDIKNNRILDGKVAAYTKLVRERLAGCHYMESEVEIIGFDEDYGKNPPPALHYSPNTYIEQGRQLLGLLGIDKNSDDISYVDKLYLKASQYKYNTNEDDKLEKIYDRGGFIDINYYIKNILSKHNLDNCIGVISCREDMARFYPKFVENKSLYLKTVPNIKDSYIAFVDFNAKCSNEYTSQKELRRKISIGDNVIKVNSKGYNAKDNVDNFNISININGTNYACNKRGLNLVVFDYEQQRVVDSVVVDMNRDEHLEISFL